MKTHVKKNCFFSRLSFGLSKRNKECSIRMFVWCTLLWVVVVVVAIVLLNIIFYGDSVCILCMWNEIKFTTFHRLWAFSIPCLRCVVVYLFGKANCCFGILIMWFKLDKFEWHGFFVVNVNLWLWQQTYETFP